MSTDLKTIVLLRKHTHHGKKYAPGAELTLAKRMADWLIEQGVGAETPKQGAVRTRDVPGEPARRGCCGKGW